MGASLLALAKSIYYCWFSHDVTKIQTTKLSTLLRFYFRDVLKQLKIMPVKRFFCISFGRRRKMEILIRNI